MRENILKQAELEFEQEKFREAVEKHKEKLRQKRSIWDRIFPYQILIIKKEK